MGRMYVASTPASRGEVDQGLYEQTLTVDALRDQAADAGFELVPVEPEKSEDGKPPAEPAGNASTADWAAYARTRGAEDADLVDGDGKPLTRDELRTKFGTPADPA